MTEPLKPSPDYFEALRRTQDHHDSSRGKTFSGNFLWKQRGRAAEIVDRFGVASLLDYGCGAGKQYRQMDERGRTLEDLLGFTTTKYDPGTRQYRDEPTGTFDMVCCVQVLNCIPVSDLKWAVDRLYGFATKVIWIVERLGVPRKAIHADMRDKMPHGITSDTWMSHLARPGSPVRLVALFKKPDQDGGEWFTVEPEDQG